MKTIENLRLTTKSVIPVMMMAIMFAGILKPVAAEKFVPSIEKSG